MLFRKKKNKTSSNIAMIDERISEQNLKEEVSRIDEDDIEILLENEENISKKISNSNAIRKYAELAQIMFAMIRDIKRGAYTNVPWFTVATVALALLYVFNPFDVIPDFIPGIGYIDDLAVLSISMGWIESDLHKYLDWRLEESKG